MVAQFVQAKGSAEIASLLQPESDGTRCCLPVFGTGLNIQACMLEGGAVADDWAALLEHVASETKMPKRQVAELPKSPLALWEQLLARWARNRKVYAYEAEKQLQRIVCETLRKREQESKSFRLYRMIVDARFREIVSLNFDRRIANAAKKQKFQSGPRPSPRGGHGESLFRHSLIHHGDGAETRVWYPHGDTKKIATLKLGVRKYGFHVGVLMEQLDGLGAAWRYKPNAVQLERGSSALARWDGRDPTWLEPFLESPLLFIGCGLSIEEWSLWWLLQERARRGCHEPAFYFTFGLKPRDPLPPHLGLAPDLRVANFSGPEELWEQFCDWIGQPLS